MEQGRGRRSGGGLRPAARGSTALREEREKGEGSTGSGSPAAARAEVARGGLATAAVDGDHGGATAELGGGQELGEKGKGGKGVLMRPLPWAEVKRGGGSAVAGGARR